MKGIESGKDKVKKICEVLKKETLEPAQREAEEVLQRAEKEARRIIEQANKEAGSLIEEARKEIEKQKNIFQSSLNQACKQSLEALKQNIEEKLFNQELSQLITRQTQDPKLLSDLISSIVKAIERDGIDTDISAIIPSAVSAKAVNSLLAHEVLQKLKDKTVKVGPITGGVEVKLHKGNVTLDITDAALKELVSLYIRKDFRATLFGS